MPQDALNTDDQYLPSYAERLALYVELAPSCVTIRQDVKPSEKDVDKVELED